MAAFVAVKSPNNRIRNIRFRVHFTNYSKENFPVDRPHAYLKPIFIDLSVFLVKNEQKP